MAKGKGQAPDSRDSCGLCWPVTITIESHLKRLRDADGTSGKAAIDGLVHAGILPDDSPQYVAEVRYRQIKSTTEKTVITLEDDSHESV